VAPAAIRFILMSAQSCQLGACLKSGRQLSQHNEPLKPGGRHHSGPNLSRCITFSFVRHFHSMETVPESLGLRLSQELAIGMLHAAISR